MTHAASHLTTPSQTTDVGSAQIHTYSHVAGGHAAVLYVDSDARASWCYVGCDAASYEAAEQALFAATGHKFAS